MAPCLDGLLPAAADLEWSKAVGLEEEQGKTPEARTWVCRCLPMGTNGRRRRVSGNYTGEETNPTWHQGHNEDFPGPVSRGSFRRSSALYEWAATSCSVHGLWIRSLHQCSCRNAAAAAIGAPWEDIGTPMSAPRASCLLFLETHRLPPLQVGGQPVVIRRGQGAILVFRIGQPFAKGRSPHPSHIDDGMIRPCLKPGRARPKT